MLTPMQVDVYVAPPVYANTGLPLASQNLWSPVSCTVVHTNTSALLIDTPITIDAANKYADWLEETLPGKVPKYVYITHAHGDHFLGLSTLQERFPDLQAIATSAVVAGIKETYTPEVFAAYTSLFGANNITTTSQPVPVALPANNTFTLDGHTIHAHDVPFSDTHATSFLHVPALSLVVAGDIVYGDCHQYLVEAKTASLRAEWLTSLHEIQALHPQIVVAGHKRASQLDGAYLIPATEAYIRAFGDEVTRASSVQDVVDGMNKRYPNRWNQYILHASAEASFAARNQTKSVTAAPIKREEVEDEKDDFDQVKADSCFAH